MGPSFLFVDDETLLSPFGVAVLEGEDKEFLKARKLLGRLWDGRSGTCQPLAWTGRGQKPEPQRFESGYYLGLLMEFSF